MTRRGVNRWSGGLGGALFLVALALLASEPLLIAASVIPLTYAVYGSLSTVPSGMSLELSRTVVHPEVRPGEPATIELTVENTGSAALTDVRLIDGVPAELAVVDGSPRRCLSLRPDEQATVTYSVMAKRGRYPFSDVAIRVRTLSASEMVTVELQAAGDEALVCTNAVSEVPLSDSTLPRAGTFATDSGGSGLEFHSTRSYQRGDPVNRINWRRYAKTNELTTIDYREEQAVRTVLVVDARQAARVTPEAGYPSGSELSAYAAERLFDALSSASVVTSVAAVGLNDAEVPGGTDPDGLAWVDESDTDSAARASAVFDSVVTATHEPDEPGDSAGDSPTQTNRKSALTTDGGLGDDDMLALLARLPPTAQVVLFSPLVDDWPVSLAESLTARNYPTTLVSPDLARRDTLGTAMFTLDRTARLNRVQRAGGTVIDWDLDRSIDVALRASLAELFSI